MKKSEFDSIVLRLKERRSIPSDIELNEFIELAKRGYDEVLQDKVSEWHISDDSETRPLHEYLGMTREEYADWLKPKGLI